MNRRPAAQGFTLIELMVVVAIVGVLTAIAIPSYERYVVKANRKAAQAFMEQVAQAQQQYLSDSRSYAADLASLQAATVIPTPQSVSTYYTVTLTATGSTVFTVTATPISTSRQRNDATLTLNNVGVGTPSGYW